MPRPPSGPGGEAAHAAGAASPGDSLAGLLGYPLRGRQGVLTAIVLVELALFLGSEELLGEAGCLFAVPRLLVVALIPGILGDVFRSTLAGKDELDEWPDYTSLLARARELLGMLIVGLFMLLPASFLLSAAGCADRLTRGEGFGGVCPLTMAAGLAIGCLVALPAFCRVAESLEILSLVRFDEQFALFRAAPSAAVRTALICWLALLVAPTVRVVVGSPRLAGVLGEALLGAYGAIVAARAAGLWARQAGRSL